ncbi:M14 family zinc carboxypeptidase [Acidovorax sp. BL-A-41-H1]|uniref:M14 family zinc carboxypeptidase n=1 Tax=Acidovorax sp. BL-A-41-H1 TaxID=3421102 RepID=UPI003F79BD64
MTAVQAADKARAPTAASPVDVQREVAPGASPALRGALLGLVAAVVVGGVLWVPAQLWPASPARHGVHGLQPGAPYPSGAAKTTAAGTAAQRLAVPAVVATRSVTPASAAPAAPAAAPLRAADEAAAACALLLPRLPGVSRSECLATQLHASGAQSRQGTPLYWRDVLQPGAAPASIAGNRPVAEPLRVLVVGAMHGDELTAASLALRWIGMAAAEGAAGLPATAGAPVHWRFIPVLNPDGLLAPKPTRVNAGGVDLNRNFPTPGWAQDAPVYWEKRTRKDPRRWPGHEPLSEPESKFLHQQMAQFQPQLVVSIHAPYGVLDFDGPHDPPARLGRLRMDKLGVFPGSLGHYGGLHRGVPVVTIELEHALIMPAEAEVRAMWRDLRQWMNTRLLEGGDAVAGLPTPGAQRRGGGGE